MDMLPRMWVLLAICTIVIGNILWLKGKVRYIHIYLCIYLYVYIHIYIYTCVRVCVCGFQMGGSQNHGCMIWAYVHCLCPMWNPGFNHIILFSNEHMSKRSKQIQTYLQWKHLPNTHISKKFCLLSVVAIL